MRIYTFSTLSDQFTSDQFTSSLGETETVNKTKCSEWCYDIIVVHNDVTMSTLQLTLRNVDEEGAGMYVCAMSILDQSFLLEREETRINVSLAGPFVCKYVST